MADWLAVVRNQDEDVNLQKVASETKSTSSSSKKTSLNKGNIFTLLDDPSTFATTLLAICLIMYGDETFKVDQLVLYQWLKEDFGNDLCEENESKLAAILAALTTNFFYTDLDVFKSTCKTLASGDPGAYDTEIFNDEPTIPEILWGMYEVALVSEDSSIDSDDFSGAVKFYVDSVFKNDINDTIDDPNSVNLQPEAIIAENVKELRNQLAFIGLSDIPKFPAFEFNDE